MKTGSYSTTTQPTGKKSDPSSPKVGQCALTHRLTGAHGGSSETLFVLFIRKTTEIGSLYISQWILLFHAFFHAYPAGCAIGNGPEVALQILNFIQLKQKLIDAHKPCFEMVFTFQVQHLH